MSAPQTPQKQIIRRSTLVCPPAPARAMKIIVDTPITPLTLNHTSLVMQNEADAFVSVTVPRTPERAIRTPVCPGAPTNKARMEHFQDSH